MISRQEPLLIRNPLLISSREPTIDQNPQLTFTMVFFLRMKVSGVLPNISISLSDVRVQEVLALVQSIPFPESAPVEEEEEEFLKVID